MTEFLEEGSWANLDPVWFRESSGSLSGYQRKSGFSQLLSMTSHCRGLRSSNTLAFNVTFEDIVQAMSRWVAFFKGWRKPVHTSWCQVSALLTAFVMATIPTLTVLCLRVWRSNRQPQWWQASVLTTTPPTSPPTPPLPGLVRGHYSINWFGFFKVAFNILYTGSFMARRVVSERWSRPVHTICWWSRYLNWQKNKQIQVPKVILLGSWDSSWETRGHGCPVVTHSPPTSEVGGSNPGPYLGKKLVVACRWSAVYSTETLTHQLYVLVSSAHKTTIRDIWPVQCWKRRLKPQIDK